MSSTLRLNVRTKDCNSHARLQDIEDANRLEVSYRDRLRVSNQDGRVVKCHLLPGIMLAIGGCASRNSVPFSDGRSDAEEGNYASYSG
jgi:hypothetical protein